MTLSDLRREQARAAYQRRLEREGKLDMPELGEVEQAAVARAIQGLLDDPGWGREVALGTVSLEAIRAEGAANTARTLARDRRTGRNWRKRKREREQTRS